MGVELVRVSGVEMARDRRTQFVSVQLKRKANI